jgi:hypothetical protein
LLRRPVFHFALRWRSGAHLERLHDVGSIEFGLFDRPDALSEAANQPEAVAPFLSRRELQGGQRQRPQHCFQLCQLFQNRDLDFHHLGFPAGFFCYGIICATRIIVQFTIVHRNQQISAASGELRTKGFPANAIRQCRTKRGGTAIDPSR